MFPNSTGYDGQLYHYVAHDPFLRTGLRKFVDDPRLRYRRILIPALAFILALGQQSRIDPAYEIVFLMAVGLGVYWSCRFVEDRGLNAAWGLCFLFIPAIPVAMDRLVIDAALAAFTIGILCYADGPQWKLVLVLACAALTRETGFLLIAAALVFPARTYDSSQYRACALLVRFCSNADRQFELQLRAGAVFGCYPGSDSSLAVSGGHSVFIRPGCCGLSCVVRYSSCCRAGFRPGLVKTRNRDDRRCTFCASRGGVSTDGPMAACLRFRPPSLSFIGVPGCRCGALSKVLAPGAGSNDAATAGDAVRASADRDLSKSGGVVCDFRGIAADNCHNVES